jgi:hypothetical protein
VSRRPPLNTQHWQFLVRVFKEIALHSCLKTAAEWAGFVNGRDLRRSVDRELNFEQMAKVDQFLIESLEQHIHDLDQRRARATSLIAEIQHASYERVTSEIETGTVDDAHMPGMLDARPMIEWWWRQFAEEPAEQPEREMIAA